MIFVDVLLWFCESGRAGGFMFVRFFLRLFSENVHVELKLCLAGGNITFTNCPTVSVEERMLLDVSCIVCFGGAMHT